MGRTFVQLIVAATLLALLAVLGTLQYRWLGEVSNAERERLRNSLRARAADFSLDFDREITRTYMAFRVDPGLFDTNAAGALSDAYARAQAASPVGGIIKTVYVLDTEGLRAGELKQLDPAARALATVEWPPEFASWRARIEPLTRLPPGLPPIFAGDAIDPQTPALFVSLPVVRPFENGTHVAIVRDPADLARTVIVRLDADRVKRQLIETLLARHFGDADASEYYVSVVSREDAGQLVYASVNGADVSPDNADLTAGLFDLRLDELGYFNTYFNTSNPPPGNDGVAGLARVKDRVAITIVRRTNGPGAARALMGGGDQQGVWRVLIRCKSGSLETLVARSRHRNLAIGLGILGLLAASFVFVIGSARRQQRLARQQMEFVAAVSHELRTPLAVIRSAGENLADGVVGDRDQVRRYGSLIRAEGRRLSDMVERVMEFAGISSGATSHARTNVDIARVIDDATNGVEPEAGERGITVTVRRDGSLPEILGDAAALRSAVQNVIGNAVKYSPNGGVVQVDASADGGERVRIAVTDRGLGIDGADIPHIFKPFFRGRRAVDAQIRGTGVGLSVVRQVVDAHQGDIRVDSRVGDGTTVVVTLPAAPSREGFANDNAEARART